MIQVDGGMLAESLPFWLEAFTAMMTEEDEAISDIGLKTEAMSCVGFIMMSHPKAVAKFLPQMLPSLWAMFVGLVNSPFQILSTASSSQFLSASSQPEFALLSLDRFDCSIYHPPWCGVPLSASLPPTRGFWALTVRALQLFGPVQRCVHCRDRGRARGD